MSANALKPAFAIPKLLELQGQKLYGTGSAFWATSSKPEGVLEDIGMLLTAVHPLLVGLNLAGYDVTNLLLATHARSVLNVNLKTLSYGILTNAPLQDGETYWYVQTGLEWDESEGGQSPSADFFLPWSTLVALSFIAEPRNRPQTGQYTYAIDLQEVLFQETNHDTGDTGLVETTAPHTDPLQSAFTLYIDQTIDDLNGSGIFSMEDFLHRLEATMFMFDFRLQTVLSERWLAVDGDPVGLLHNLSPDSVTETLGEMPTGKPDQWGSEYQLSDTATLIVDECRGVWQYLQTLSDAVIYSVIATNKTSEVMKDAREYLNDQNKLKFSFVPSRGRSLRFAHTIRSKVIENTGFDMKTSLVRQLYKLPWAELLMLMHNLYVVDILSGVTVDEDTQILAYYPDVTGFYESVNGDITVQINQAGGYRWGFMQQHVPTEVVVDEYANVSYMLNQIGHYRIEGATVYYHDLVNPPALPTVAYTITDEEITVYDDAFLVEWTLSTGELLTLARYLEAPVLPDELLDGLPKDEQGSYPPSVHAFRLTQRAPFGPNDEVLIDNSISIIKSYLQEYHGSTLPLWPSQLGAWLQLLIVELQAFIVVDEVLTIVQTNEQFPLLNYILRARLQDTPLELTETDTRSLYIALLELLEARGASGLKPLDEFILLVTGITIDEAVALLADEATEALADGDYTYRFRSISIGAAAAYIVAGALNLASVQIQRIDNEGNVLWDNTYIGMFMAVGFGFGGKIKADIKSILKAAIEGLGSSVGVDWTMLYARTQWEPSDFSGLMTVSALEAAVSCYVGLKFNFGSRTTFFEITKGLELGYGRLVAGTNYVSIWNTIKSAFLGILKLNIEFGVGASVSGTITYGSLFKVLFVGSVAENGFFEPMQESSSYISPVPTLDNQNVHFAVASAVLTSEGEGILTLLVAKLRAYFINPLTYLEIHGFASPSGSDEFNLQLSADRAQAVYNFLYALLGDTFAIPTHHTTVMGHGEWDARYLDKIDDGTEVAEWRRVDVVVNGVLVCSIFGEKDGF